MEKKKTALQIAEEKSGAVLEAVNQKQQEEDEKERQFQNRKTDMLVLIAETLQSFDGHYGFRLTDNNLNNGSVIVLIIHINLKKQNPMKPEDKSLVYSITTFETGHSTVEIADDNEMLEHVTDYMALLIAKAQEGK